MNEAILPAKACVHCGHPAAGGGIQIGTDADGNHLVACIPTCPKPATGQSENGAQR